MTFIITDGIDLSSGNFRIVPSISIGTSTSPIANAFLDILVKFLTSFVSVSITGYFDIIFKNISSPPSLSFCGNANCNTTNAAPFLYALTTIRPMWSLFQGH